MALFDDIKEVVVEQLNVSPDEVYQGYPKPKRLRSKTNTSTKKVEELVKELERKFNIEIPDDQGEAIATVKDAIKFIERV